jgi:endonuclease/exonuclease/phosphatase family metal-dependent hydrolase
MTRALATLLLVVLGQAGYSSAPVRVRVLTYNIHHGEGIDGRIDLPRLAEVIIGTKPDLVALQEVDRGTERAGGVDQLAELERLTGMHGVFGKAMDFQGGAYGVAVLTRHVVVGSSTLALPDLAGREPRAALTVDVRIKEADARLQFITTHLDQGRDNVNRLAQASFLNATVAPDDSAPRVLAGDMNSRPGTEVMQLLLERWTNFFEVPEAVAPRGLVDHVFARPASDWRAVDGQVVEDRIASDHRPLLVVLEWNPSSSH